MKCKLPLSIGVAWLPPYRWQVESKVNEWDATKGELVLKSCDSHFKTRRFPISHAVTLLFVVPSHRKLFEGLPSSLSHIYLAKQVTLSAVSQAPSSVPLQRCEGGVCLFLRY